MTLRTAAFASIALALIITACGGGSGEKVRTIIQLPTRTPLSSAEQEADEEATVESAAATADAASAELATARAQPTATEPASEDEEPLGDPLRSEAEGLCPQANANFYAACVDITISTLSSSLPGVMCINEVSGQWYWATPGATPLPGFDGRPNQATAVGMPCAEDDHFAVKVINFP